VVRVHNTSRNSELASSARVADQLGSRLRGLMFTDGLGTRDGLVIDPCNSIHMCFMRYPIDVIFVDAEDAVVGQVENIQPWRFTKIYWGARRAVELPSGRIAQTGTHVGDTLEFRPVTNA
jgi:hypothetical protein